MDYNIYEKGNMVFRALPGTQNDLELSEDDSYTLKGTSANPDPKDEAVPSLSQKAPFTKTSADKKKLLQIDKEVTDGYGNGA